MAGPHPASLAQRRAADPEFSVWVSANAGSGKTRVLTDRVARLLLEGARPERILCLTYTKAAAAEMADRLAQRLGRWALLEDAPLAEALSDLTGAPARDFAASRLRRARTLFAEALETPGGLKIQTIHAFCDSVLRRFPAEAGVAPGFEVIEEDARAALIDEALEAMAEDAAAGRDDAFDRLAADFTEESLGPLVQAILSHRARFEPPPDPGEMAALFGVDLAELSAAPFNGLNDIFCETRLRALIAALRAGGGKREAGFADTLTAALRQSDPPARAAALRPAFRDSADKPRKLSKLATKKALAADAGAQAAIDALAEAFEAACAREAARADLRAALHLNRFAQGFLTRFDTLKAARGALDYDDLIEAVRRLLHDSASAQWALYKLDGGVDHILLDEAQDTSPAQWQTTRRLIEELHAGLGANEAARSLFVVGDEKQSIYSFQGAAPEEFDRMRGALRDRFRAGGRRWADQSLIYSFRSAGAILRVVDQSFQGEAAQGLNAAGAPPEHTPFHGFGGRVDLWPAIEPEENPREEDWTTPLDAPPAAHPKLRLAAQIAREIARMIAEEELPGGGGIVAGDILVLVRKRDVFAAELLRELKRRGVPVAGADRMRLSAEIAVQDLLALARFALTPEDDLTLAALLRSPLCGLSEEGLFSLAHPRARGEHLWEALRQRAGEFPQAMSVLRDALETADFLRPYEFFSRALIRMEGRARLLARLGAEAEDAIDELMERAMAHEREEAPTLEGFLDAMSRRETVIKREMEGGAGAVRVMTVHGAKGLEAPVVILVDLDAGRGGRAPALYPHQGAALRAGGSAATQAAKAAHARAEAEESRRLLYVAMTRAERWLIVARAGTPPKTEHWRGLVEAGLRRLAAPEVAPPPGLESAMLRYESLSPAQSTAPAAAPTPQAAPPDWLFHPAPPDHRPRLRAATALGAEPQRGGIGRGRDAALARGLAIHAALEGAPAADLPKADRAEAEAALALAARAGFMGPDSLAEAELALDLPERGLRIAGRVDRVQIGPAIARLLDFKTDPIIPDTAEDVPDAHLRQMAVYTEALTRLHPNHEIEAWLLYTAGPRLLRLPLPLLREALARLGDGSA